MGVLNTVPRVARNGEAPDQADRRHDTSVWQAMRLEWIVASVAGIALGGMALVLPAFPARWAFLLVLAILCLVAMLITGSVRKLALAAIILDLTLQVDISLGMRGISGHVHPAIEGWSISLTTIGLVVLYALWGANLLTRSEAVPNLRKTSVVPLAIYLGFVLLSAITALDVTASLFELFMLLQMFLLYVYVASNVRTKEDVIFIVLVLLVGVILGSAIIIGKGFPRFGSSLSGGALALSAYEESGVGFRSGGTIGSPNTAASYLSLLLALGCTVAFLPLARRYRLIGLAAFACDAAALVVTLSRGGWIAAVISVTVLCVVAWLKGWLHLRAFVAMILVAGLTLFLFNDVIIARVFGNDRGSANSRIDMAMTSLKIIEDHPVLGVGANNFSLVVAQYAWRDLGGGNRVSIMHDKYLLIWAELGFGGLAAFLVFLLATLRRGWHVAWLQDPLLSPLALALTAGIVGQMVHMLVEIFNTRPQVEPLWLVAGLVTAICNIAKKG